MIIASPAFDASPTGRNSTSPFTLVPFFCCDEVGLVPLFVLSIPSEIVQVPVDDYSWQPLHPAFSLPLRRVRDLAHRRAFRQGAPGLFQSALLRPHYIVSSSPVRRTSAL